jgi:hypothetical protein
VVSAACEHTGEQQTRSEHLSQAAIVDSPIVQSRADWEYFEQHLSRDPERAAVALERYRERLGLPFTFAVRTDAPASIARTLKLTGDEMCGATITAFVRRFPGKHPVLDGSAVVEFDSTGRTVRRWPLPADLDYWELVAGVSGDELVATYLDRNGVYMRIRPDGEYHLSARPPQALESEEWIEVADSVYLRVKPRDLSPYSMYPGTRRPEALGTWVPRGDSGWYVRTDSVPGERTTAHVVTLPHDPEPQFIACPVSLDGMQCRMFPDDQKKRRLAYPTPCT